MHSIPLARHLGRNKTTSSILQCFYWPTLLKDVASYSKSCSKCQKTSRHAPPAPLIPLPIINKPFSWILMDIVGRSHLGKKYILVVCNYTTPYPEAIVLRSIEAECITKELVQLLSHAGVPQEILTDQSANFTS